MSDNKKDKKDKKDDKDKKDKKDDKKDKKSDKDKKDKKEKKEKKGKKEYTPDERITILKMLLPEDRFQFALSAISALPEDQKTPAINKLLKGLTDQMKHMVDDHFEALDQGKSIFKEEKDLFKDIKDWSNYDEITNCWPAHIKAQMASSKSLIKTVDLNPFSMKKPLSTEYLLEDAQLLFEPLKRNVLYGDPLCGKTVLFEILSGQEGMEPCKEFPAHIHCHLCTEISVSPQAKSVIDTVVSAHTYRNALLKSKDGLEARIKYLQALEAGIAEPLKEGEAPIAKPEQLEKLEENMYQVQFRLEQMSSDTAVDRASKMLRVLGFDEEAQKKSTNSLSGGLRMRVALCAAFFIEPDLLLLDEPTNHLDFPSVLWLENRLRAYRKSFCLISHDRELLEKVCSSVMLFKDRKIVYYNCGFAEFEKRKTAADKKYADEVEKFMQRNRNVDSASPLAREKREKQNWVDKYYALQVALADKFTFPKAANLKDQPEGEHISLIDLVNVRFSYDQATLPFIFDTPICFDVRTNTRCGVMGPNGAGKSTLLKLLTDRLAPTYGTVTRHPTMDVGYFAQHHAAELDMKLTPIEFMAKSFPEESTGFLRKHLGKVGIVGPMAETRLSGLSGGQRSCTMFAKITFKCPHLLIMDEPTNFLDLASVDSLINATNKYPGALLLVSHNRSFLNKCATHYLSVVPGKFLMFDNLKDCEQSTYTFIKELEEGGHVGGSGLLSGQSTHFASKVGGAHEEKKQ